MYTVTTVYHRPVASIPFFGATAEGAAVAKRFNDLLKVAPGFVSVTVESSADKLSSTSIYTWETKKAFDTFVAANKAVFDADSVARNAYHNKHGITREMIKS